jgi:hypothetical protein
MSRASLRVPYHLNVSYRDALALCAGRVPPTVRVQLTTLIKKPRTVQDEQYADAVLKARANRRSWRR